MFEHGWGVAADREEAIAWYRRAAQRGHEVAAVRLAELAGGAAGTAAPAAIAPDAESAGVALHRAIELGDANAVRDALARGADPNAAVGARSLLTDAVERGDLGLAEALLRAGADPSAVDAAGDTRWCSPRAREGRRWPRGCSPREPTQMRVTRSATARSGSRRGAASSRCCAC
jgi:TPR repeat protein